ncbi:tripartite tricarboxylate transporter substrate binding protein [Falsiroseomonas selenitidurans]|uniref:Tripartite tricarboxylate transporter substrate binding protein n=1 Tax=Falsiroseomonas selenitidurans TaxID=2716335 RepID=A0ABX1DX59_9PROT|nr:tripartite tricarboxylate transporter substrate binding protein [Falsiroseomonas selenitidurans]NKC29504.1 tripartite tricarboxylate transporter substrate binding protein [Falsiroseomonas selenitidurans]
MPMRLLGALCALLLASAPALAFPDRPIRLVVPYGPGGITDIAARILAPRLGEALGQQVVVDNRPGGAAQIGFGLTARAEPDGHTLVLATTALAANPVLFRVIPYDARRDFTPVSLVGLVPMVLVVHPSSPAHTVRDFIALVRSRGGEMTYGSAGNGSGNHLSTAMFNHAAGGLQALHVPYRGGGQVMTDLVGGRLGYVFAVLPTARPFIVGGQLRAIAVTGAARSSALPEVPTVAEAALPGFALNEWLGLLGPAGLPAPVVAKLHESVVAALRNPDAAARFREIGVEVAGSDPEGLRRHLDRELTRWADLATHVRFEVAE